jgi:hypothetical protein
MSRPSFLTLSTITCLETEDFTGSDDLVGVMGNDRFAFGRFAAQESYDIGVTRPIDEGVTELSIVEVDDIDPDDELITIDLTQDMDVDRVVGIMTGRARYDVAFKVTSESTD